MPPSSSGSAPRCAQRAELVDLDEVAQVYRTARIARHFASSTREARPSCLTAQTPKYSNGQLIFHENSSTCLKSASAAPSSVVGMDIIIKKSHAGLGRRRRRDHRARERIASLPLGTSLTCLFGPERLRQEHARANHRRDRACDRRAHQNRRSDRSVRAARKTWRALGHDVAEPQSVSLAQRDRAMSPSELEMDGVPRAARYARAQEMLATVGLKNFRNIKPATSSPAACASASRWRARWSWTGPFC